MKVDSRMINKDIRTAGVVIRKVFRFRKEKQFLMCNKLLGRFMKGRFPRDMNTEERHIPRPDGTSMRIVICYPEVRRSDSEGVLWIHGGGYALGIPEQEMGYARAITENTSSVVVLPDYTLSVDRPYPAALEDCYTALLWMKDHAPELGININQLFVAGGGLTAALTLYARVRKEVKIAFQMPLYPMLDCRMETASMKDNDAPVWDAEANRLGWKLYLGKLYGSENIPCYASPSWHWIIQAFRPPIPSSVR